MPINVYSRDFSGIIEQYTPQGYMGVVSLPADGVDVVTYLTGNGVMPGYCSIIDGVWGPFDHTAWGLNEMPATGNYEGNFIQFAQEICATINGKIGGKLCDYQLPPASMNTNLDLSGYCNTSEVYDAPLMEAFFLRFYDGFALQSEMEIQSATYEPVNAGSETHAVAYSITASNAALVNDTVIPIPYEDALNVLGFNPPDRSIGVTRLTFTRSPTQTIVDANFPLDVSQYGDKGDILMPSPTQGLMGAFMDMWLTSPKYDLQDGGVIPPTPNKMLGFIYDSVDFPTPDVKFPPFNTRVPFQNYARAVPAVFIKRK